MMTQIKAVSITQIRTHYNMDESYYYHTMVRKYVDRHSICDPRGGVANYSL